MTEITTSEIKLIYIQIFLMAIIGVFIFLYVNQPITQSYNINSQASNSSSVSGTDASWITGLTPKDAGLGSLLPNGVADIIIVSSVFLVPLTIMNLFTAIRFIKDIATQWV